MPSQLSWFHRLDEILADLLGYDTNYIVRPAWSHPIWCW